MNRKNNPIQYIRSLIFCKATLRKKDFLNPECLFGNIATAARDDLAPRSEPVAGFVTLGTYDALFSQRILYNTSDQSPEGPAEGPSNNPLRQIARVNRDITINLLKKEADGDDDYFETIHPSYIVSSFEDNLSEADHIKFWDEFDRPFDIKTQKCFFFVTNVYMLGADLKEKVSQMYGKISDALNELKKPDKFEFIIYRTLDICDFVIVWKADDVRIILHALQLLLNNQLFGEKHEKPTADMPSGCQVGFTHTICALPRSKLSVLYTPSVSFLDFPVYKIPLIIIQAVKDYSFMDDMVFKVARKPLEKYELFPPHFTFGLQDFLAGYKDVPPVALYQYVYNIVNLENLSLTRISTQLGRLEGDLPLSRERLEPEEHGIEKREKLMVACKTLKIKYTELFNAGENLAFFKRQLWWEPLCSLLRVFSANDGSCLYDEVAYLAMSGLTYFYCWLKHMTEMPLPEGCSDRIDRREMLFSPFKKSINHFILSLEDFIVSVVHSDSTVSQEPNPDMPNLNMTTGVIEFCGAFFSQFCRYLKLLDIEDAHTDMPDASYLLVPSLCRRIKTDALFTVSQLREQMYFIELPFESMHIPFIICASLAHESMHFYGDDPRNRSKRFGFFETCVSVAVANLLGIPNLAAIFRLADEMDERVKERLTNTNRIKDGKKTGKNPSYGYFLSDLSIACEQALTSIIFGETFYDEMINYLLSLDRFEDAEIEAAKKAFAKNLNSLKVETLTQNQANYRIAAESDIFIYPTIGQIIRDTVMFFKEGYADVIILNDLLGIDFKEYYYMLSDTFKVDRFELPGNLDKETGMRGYYRPALIMQRILLVCYAHDYNKGAGARDYLGQMLSDGCFFQGHGPVTKFRNNLLKLLREIAPQYYEAMDGYMNKGQIADAAHKYPGFYPYQYHERIISYFCHCMRSVNEAHNNRPKKDERDQLLHLLRSSFDEYARDRILFGRHRRELLCKNRDDMMNAVIKLAEGNLPYRFD